MSRQEWGRLFRLYRRESRDPLRGGALTQNRLADLLVERYGVAYSRATISDWEKGKSQIPHDQRHVLLCLIKLFYECGGVQMAEQVDAWLTAGNYRALTAEEWQEIAPHESALAPPPASVPMLARNPYRGLEAFREEDADYYFGREPYIEQLLHLITEQRQPFVPIIGASGSGKSSLVQAGLLPSLHHTEQWCVVQLRPGGQPFANLAHALLPHYEEVLTETAQLVESKRLAEALRDQVLGLHDVAALIRDKHPATPHLLLFIDQFEELYTLSDPAPRRSFLDQLLLPLSLEPFPLTVLFTLRADFLGVALGYPPLAASLDHAPNLMLGAMDGAALIQVIEQPAQLAGAQFETRLAARIAEELDDEPGHLPLLQFALTLLWEQQEAGRLTHRAYEAIGGVAGALTHYADGVYARLSAAEREQMQRVAVQLVAPGLGTEDTRRLATKTELPRDSWPLVTRLATERLLVTGRAEGDEQVETVEVVHEALIQRWGQLRGWLEEDRAFRLWQDGLRQAMRGWQGQDDVLLRGGKLEEAEEWLAERGAEISDQERAFVEASQALRQRNERLRQVVVTGAIGAAVIMFVLALLALNTSNQLDSTLATLDANLVVAQTREAEAIMAQAEAERQQRRAQAQALAAQAPLVWQRQRHDTELASLLAVQALRWNERHAGDAQWQIDAGLRPILSEKMIPYSNILRGHENFANAVAFSPDGTILASASDDNTILLWSTIDPHVPPTPLVGHEGVVNAVAFSPDGTTLASASSDGSVRLWSVDNPDQAPQIVAGGQRGWVRSVAFSPDGTTLVSANEDRTVRVWSLDDLNTPTILSGHTGRVLSVTFSPDGSLLASASSDGEVHLRSTDDLLEIDMEIAPVIPAGYEDLINAVAFSPDGSTLALATADHTIRLCSTADPDTELDILWGHENWVNAVAFAPDGTTLASASSDGTIRLWLGDDAYTDSVIIEGHEDLVNAVAFSPDGSLLASASADHTIRLWSLNAPKAAPLVFSGSPGQVKSITFSPDGAMFASGHTDHAIRLWSADNPNQALATLEGHEGWVRSVAFTPDGTALASASSDGMIRLWSTDGRETEPVILNHGPVVNAVAFSPDGHTLASASTDRTIRLWSTDGPYTEYSTLRHERVVNAMAFSPDGDTLASASTDGTVRLWSLATLTQTHVFRGPVDDGINAVAFVADGERLASAGRDGMVRLWSLATLTQTHVFEGHEGWVNDVAFAPDGQTLASVSADGTVRLWSLSDLRAEPILLTGHEDAVGSVAFAPDGQTLASASDDGTVRVWVWRLGELSDMACNLTWRNMTFAEWDRYVGPDTPYECSCPTLPPHPSVSAERIAAGMCPLGNGQ